MGRTERELCRLNEGWASASGGKVKGLGEAVIIEPSPTVGLGFRGKEGTLGEVVLSPLRRGGSRTKGGQGESRGGEGEDQNRPKWGAKRKSRGGGGERTPTGRVYMGKIWWPPPRGLSRRKRRRRKNKCVLDDLLSGRNYNQDNHPVVGDITVK